jgi:glucans biosynthesis protein
MQFGGALNVHVALLGYLVLAVGINAVDAAEDLKPEAISQEPRIQFGFADVHRRAQELAAGPFAADRPELPGAFQGLSYDQYRDIRFRPERAVWRGEGLPFQVQLFPRGFMFLDRVKINIIDSGEAVPVAFSRALFDYGRNPVPEELPADIGFAGLRFFYPLHRDDHFDEVAVFLGASYFRAIGQNQTYGLSARGLAIDTGLASQEEFPLFREFWLEKPDKDATELTLYALMDSRRATGAYRFVIRPGLQTVMEVKAHIFMRERVEKLGVAPLTSMFYHGELTERYMADFRPEVHDSEGLLVETGNGERIWRPLINPRRLRISTFQVTDPKGFGLFQRDRVFDHYQDLEAHYHRRPSAWVEPLGQWGQGRVELVEIPSSSERYDNIVVFWVPAKPTEAGQGLEFDYRIRFALDPEARLRGGRTIATRIGAGGTDEPQPDRRKFVIDFVGENLKGLEAEPPVEAVVNASSGKIINAVAEENPYTGGWRAFFELVPDSDQPVDLRCFLKRGPDMLTETWSFQWMRD